MSFILGVGGLVTFNWTFLKYWKYIHYLYYYSFSFVADVYEHLGCLYMSIFCKSENLLDLFEVKFLPKNISEYI